MNLPERAYFSLEKAAKEINGDIYDILHYISVGKLDVSIKIDLAEYIDAGEIKIRGKFDEALLAPSSKKIFNHQSNHATIKELITLSSDGNLITRTVKKAKGVFSIRVAEFFQSELNIVSCKEFLVSQLYPVRLPTLDNNNLHEYNPRVIAFSNKRLCLTLDDLIITKEEIQLLKIGGVSISRRLNNPTTDKLPDEIKAKLQIYYENQSKVVSVGKPKNIYKDMIITIAMKTREKYPYSSTAMIIRKIHSLLELHDPKLTPKEGTIRNILCAVGIGKTGHETKDDFDLVIPSAYYEDFKLNN